MICSRKTLLRKLRALAPAVAENAIVPAYTHVCFTGGHLIATNERIAMSVPHVSDFQGLVPARSLVDFLDASTASAVEITCKSAGKVSVTIGDATLELPMQPRENFRFEMPPQVPLHPLTTAFLYGVEHCLQSISSYARVPDQLGVTVLIEGRDIRLFSTNRATIAASRVTIPDFKLQERVIMSTDFCKQMLALAASARTLRLAVRDTYALFAADDVTLFGRLVESDNPLDFVATVARHLPKGYRDKSVAIPQALHSVVRRCAGVTNVVGNETRTTITVKGGTATFAAKSDRGELTARVPLPGHRNAKIAVNADLLVTGLAWAERFLVTRDAVIMSRGVKFYLCAAFEN